MGTQLPQQLGGTIAAADSASLSAVNANGLPPGTQAWNADVGAFFRLTISTAALVTDEVLEVLNTVGSRWILVASGTGSVESVTGDGIDNTDPDNPVFDLLDAITDATPAAVTGALDPATTLAAGTISAVDQGALIRFGADLGDSTVSIAPGTLKIGASRLPAATLTGNRVLTVENTDATNGDTYAVLCQDKTAFTYTIKNAAAATMFTHGPNATQSKIYLIYFSTDHWVVNTAYFTR